LLQVGHLLALGAAFFNFVKNGTINILVPPPAAGWTLQTTKFFLSQGYVDFLNIILSFIFVYSFVKHKKYSLWLGLVTSSASLYSILLFIYPIYSTGAFFQNTLHYSIMAILFSPVIIIFGIIVNNVKKFWENNL